MQATELYAKALGSSCEGQQQCHWCGGPCNRLWNHDDVIPLPFIKSTQAPRCPSNSYICIGCWLFRRKSTTITFLDSSFSDRQAPINHSWWITQKEARAINNKSSGEILNLLIQPPNQFALSIVSSGNCNLLHTTIVNNISEIYGNTKLHFNFNNRNETYCIYELQEALNLQDISGREPGVQTLINIFGMPPNPKKDQKLGRGRPREQVVDGKISKKLITLSGTEVVTA